MPRKAYNLLYTDKQGIPHEYMAILEEEASKNREKHLEKIMRKHSDVAPYSPEGVYKGTPIMLEATLVSEDLQAYVDVLTRMEGTSFQRRQPLRAHPDSRNPQNKPRAETSSRVHWLCAVQPPKEKPQYGIIVNGENQSHKTETGNALQRHWHIVRHLRDWTAAQAPASPPVLLNRTLSPLSISQGVCSQSRGARPSQFAEEHEYKEITAQNKKGIFTVTQFSYTYHPRRRRKGETSATETLPRPQSVGDQR